jgi:hypothetical protein
LREDYANGSYGVGPFEQAPAASVEPLEFNRVACGDGFDRPEPTCAVACEQARAGPETPRKKYLRELHRHAVNSILSFGWIIETFPERG